MVVKIHIDAENHRRLIVRGRDVDFWDPSEPFYGVDEATVGPANEPAETVGIEATTATISSVLSSASPGDVILLRAGTYSGNETVPAGSEGSPIVVKPFGGETVTISGAWTLNSHNELRGVFLNGAANSYALNITQASATPKTGIVLAYLEVTGGTIESIRIAQNVTDSRIHHCYFRGGTGTNHCLKMHWEASSWAPTNIETDHNVITHDDGGDEDGMQIEGWGYQNIHHNLFRDIVGEDGFDAKGPNIGTGVLCEFHHNYIDNESALFHSAVDADMRIFDNYFFGNTVKTFGGDTEVDGYTDVQRNVFEFSSASFPARIHWRNQTDSIFTDNQVTNGQMRMGNTGDIEPVSNLLVANNIFDGSNITAEAATTIASGSTGNDLDTVTDPSEWSALGIT